MATSSFEFIVDGGSVGSRLDQFLAAHLTEYSRTKLRVAITSGQVTVDGKTAKPSFRLLDEQIVRGELDIESSPLPVGEDIPLDVLYEDDHLVVINKPPQMVVHPSKGHWSGTLTAALIFRFENTLSQHGGEQRPGIVHRLDRDTSGVIIVARNDSAHIQLAKQFEERTVEKEYLAVVSPAPEFDRDWIDQPIGPHSYQREKMMVRQNHSQARDAKTFYEVIERFGKYGVVKALPKTGRTHQIRVHLQFIGCPVVADKLYAGHNQIRLSDLMKPLEKNLRSSAESNGPVTDHDPILIDRQALHARRIQFDHPVSGQRMEISAPIPDDIARLIEALKNRDSQ